MNELSMNDINNVFSLKDVQISDQDCSESLPYILFQSVAKDVNVNNELLFKKIAASSPVIGQAMKSLKSSEKIRLVFSEEVEEKLSNGTFNLMKVKDDKSLLRAIAVDSHGEIKEIAKISFDEVRPHIDLMSLTTSMQGMAIQQQLQDISRQLEEMRVDMHNILKGQHNDRIALYYSGEALLKESLAIYDTELRSQIELSALQTLTQGCSSLKLSLNNDIQKLNSCRNSRGTQINTKKMKVQDIEECVYMIKSSIETIHKCVYLKSAIYCKRGEYKALTILLNEYKLFLTHTFDPDLVKLLYNYDRSERKLDDFWNKVSNTFPTRIDKLFDCMNIKCAYLETKGGVFT